MKKAYLRALLIAGALGGVALLLPRRSDAAGVTQIGVTGGAAGAVQGAPSTVAQSVTDAMTQLSDWVSDLLGAPSSVLDGVPGDAGAPPAGPVQPGYADPAWPFPAPVVEHPDAAAMAEWQAEQLRQERIDARYD